MCGKVETRRWWWVAKEFALPLAVPTKLHAFICRSSSHVPPTAVDDTLRFLAIIQRFSVAVRVFVIAWFTSGMSLLICFGLLQFRLTLFVNKPSHEVQVEQFNTVKRVASLQQFTAVFTRGCRYYAGTVQIVCSIIGGVGGRGARRGLRGDTHTTRKRGEHLSGIRPPMRPVPRPAVGGAAYHCVMVKAMCAKCQSAGPRIVTVCVLLQVFGQRLLGLGLYTVAHLRVFISPVFCHVTTQLCFGASSPRFSLIPPGGVELTWWTVVGSTPSPCSGALTFLMGYSNVSISSLWRRYHWLNLGPALLPQ